MNKFITLGFTLLLALFLAGCNKKHDDYSFTVKGLADGESVLFTSGDKQATAMNEGCVTVSKDDLGALVASSSGVEVCNNGGDNKCGEKSKKGGFEVTKDEAGVFKSTVADSKDGCTALAAADGTEAPADDGTETPADGTEAPADDGTETPTDSTEAPDTTTTTTS